MDKFLEAYDRSMGPKSENLVEKTVSMSKEFFAEGRYPKRHRVPTFCFWRNEKSIYKNTGDGIEIVGLLLDEDSTRPAMKQTQTQTQTQKSPRSSEKKKVSIVRN